MIQIRNEGGAIGLPYFEPNTTAGEVQLTKKIHDESAVLPLSLVVRNACGRYVTATYDQNNLSAGEWDGLVIVGNVEFQFIFNVHDTSADIEEPHVSGVKIR